MASTQRAVRPGHRAEQTQAESARASAAGKCWPPPGPGAGPEAHAAQDGEAELGDGGDGGSAEIDSQPPAARTGSGDRSRIRSNGRRAGGEPGHPPKRRSSARSVRPTPPGKLLGGEVQVVAAGCRPSRPEPLRTATTVSSNAAGAASPSAAAHPWLFSTWVARARCGLEQVRFGRRVRGPPAGDEVGCGLHVGRCPAPVGRGHRRCRRAVRAPRGGFGNWLRGPAAGRGAVRRGRRRRRCPGLPPSCEQNGVGGDQLLEAARHLAGRIAKRTAEATAPPDIADAAASTSNWRASARLPASRPATPEGEGRPRSAPGRRQGRSGRVGPVRGREGLENRFRPRA